MPKSETSNSNVGLTHQSPRHRPNWTAAVICFIFGAYVAVAMLGYHPTQSTLRSTGPVDKNPVGWIGADAVWILLYTLGASAWLLPIFLFWMLYSAVRNARHLAMARIIAMTFAITALAGLAAMFESFKSSDYFPNGPGGWVGMTIYQHLLADALGAFGTGLLLGTVYFFSLLFIFTKDIGSELEKLFHSFSQWRQERVRMREDRSMQDQREQDRDRVVAAAARSVATTPATPIGPTGKKVFVPKSPEKPAAKLMPPPAAEPAAEAITSAAAAVATPATPKPAKAERPKPDPEVEVVPAARRSEAPAKVELNIVKPEELKKAKVTLPQSTDVNYQFPPLDLLKEQVKSTPGNSEEEHRQNAENLLRILGEFGVEVTLGEIHVGPVITRYEVVPAAGVRVEKIAGLDKNIALGMRAQSVRILAPIPGKAAVGVEVPNQHPTPVGMRELLEAEDWANAKAEIPIALGKDVSGVPLISDLAKMPHLLIAGATGSGKSVCINSIVASILYSKSPKDLRMIMVDPKVVELKIFNSLPHMFIPVVTEPKKVPAALKWLLGEMEQRYQIFAKVNVRNIVGFNSRRKTAKTDATDPGGAQAFLEGVDPSRRRRHRDSRPPALYRRDHRRAGRLDDGGPGGNRDRASRAWHSSPALREFI